MKALAAVVLIVLQALAAAALFLLSIHGPAGLTVGAPLYLGVAAALTWWASRKSWTLLILTGAAMLAAAPGLHFVLDKAERIAYDRRIAATQVAEVRDEPILSAGRPIGVRLSYQVIAPARGYFAILPAIHGSGSAEGFGLQPRRWTFDGRGGIEFGPFEPGKRHEVMVELYPETYSFSFGPGGAACARPLSRPPPQAGQPVPLLVEIYESHYGSTARGGREERTRSSYDMAALYRNVMAALPACKVGP
jgi:hypothetical protein